MIVIIIVICVPYLVNVWAGGWVVPCKGPYIPVHKILSQVSFLVIQYGIQFLKVTLSLSTMLLEPCHNHVLVHKYVATLSQPCYDLEL